MTERKVGRPGDVIISKEQIEKTYIPRILPKAVRYDARGNLDGQEDPLIEKIRQAFRDSKACVGNDEL